MAERLKITVVVDDYPSERGVERGVLPVHGLGLHVELRAEDGRESSVLIDGGPLPDVLLHNAEALGVEVRTVSAAVATMWSAHHVGALLSLASERSIGRTYMPPPPKRSAGGLESLPEVGALLLPTASPIYNERLVLMEARAGYVVVVPCSAYGIDVALSALRSFEEAEGASAAALIGGFNLSTFSKYDTRLLLKYARARGALLVPLHSTSIEAREKLCKRAGLEEVPGSGSTYVFE